MAEKQSFSSQVDRLEEIVRELEDESIDLDRALELFEEGVTRLKEAREVLARSQLQVKKVLEAADGTLQSDDIEI